MNANDKVTARGQVTPSFIDVRTGKVLPWDTRHNTLSYNASKAIAGAFGGDSTVIPNRIGIVYGPADLTFSAIDRDQEWDAFGSDLKEKGCDVQICTFSYSPTVEHISDGSTTGYGVTFHAHTVYDREGYFEYKKTFDTNDTIYHGVLLNETNGKYTILARVDLKPASTNRRTKPDNFEVALDWTIKFF